MDSLSQVASESLFKIENGSLFRLLCLFRDGSLSHYQLIISLTHSQKPQKFLFSVSLIFGWAPVGICVKVASKGVLCQALKEAKRPD